jgi:hypothetical protein
MGIYSDSRRCGRFEENDIVHIEDDYQTATIAKTRVVAA